MTFSCLSLRSSQVNERYYNLISKNILSKFRKLIDSSKYIRQKFIKFKNLLKGTHRQRNWSNKDEDTMSSTNIESTVERSVKCENNDISSTTSLLYCKDAENQLYQVAFRTCNVKVSPLHSKIRKVPDFDNDKQSQSLNKVKYREMCNFKGGKFWITKRIFVLIKKNKKKGTLRGLDKVYPIKVFKSDEVLEQSELRREQLKKGYGKTIPNPIGELHLSFNEIIFYIRCEILNLDSGRNIVFNNTGYRQSVFGSTSLFNHATIAAKYKEDILEIKFDICQVTAQQIILMKNKSSQVVEGNTYIPYISNVTDRFVYIPLALSTFSYQDPMIKWRYINRFNSINKINPHWMKQIRKERLQKKTECEVNKKKLIETDSLNSTILVETGGTKFRIKGGMVDIKHIINTAKYESYMVNCQRDTLAKKLRKIRPIPKKEAVVPDWNIEMNDI